MKFFIRFGLVLFLGMYSLSRAADPGGLGIRHDDAWELPNIIIGDSTPAYNAGGLYFDLRDMFGGVFGTHEPGTLIFQDKDMAQQSSILATYHVEWETLYHIKLSGYGLYSQGDIGRHLFHFRLLADVDGNGSYEATLADVQPILPFMAHQTNMLAQPVVAKRFRAEFVPNLILHGQSPRVFELDAITIPDPDIPTVHLVTPADNVETKEGTDIAFEATAVDNDEILRVDYVANGKTLATGTEPPKFAASWKAEAGEYTVTAVAIDLFGSEGTSDNSINILVAANPVRLIHPIMNPDGTFSFTIEGLNTSQNRSIFSSTNLVDWVEISNTLALETTEIFTDAESQSVNPIFYKVSQ